MNAPHWTDEQLVSHLYGVGPEDGHLNECPECRSRIAGMQSNRQLLEAIPDAGDGVSPEFLARQRRAIYAGLGKPRRAFLPRWAPAIATLAVAAAGFIVLEERHQASHPPISDAQLVEEVSQMAQDPTPSAVAPMEALFQE